MNEQLNQIITRLDGLNDFVAKQKEMDGKQADFEGKIKSVQEVVDEMKKELDGAVEEAKFQRKIGVENEIFDSERQAKRFLEWMRDSVKTNKAMAGDVDASGGYLVPTEFMPTLVDLIKEYGDFRRGATLIPMMTDTLTMPELESDATVYWLSSQNSSITESTPSLSLVTLTVKNMAALVAVSNELLADSGIDVANMLARMFARLVAKEEDTQGFTGNTGGGDPFDGILNVSGTGAVTMSAGNTNFSDITADNLADMIVAAEDDRDAFFCMHRTIFSHVRKLKDMNGQYIYQAPAGNEPATIWGYPFIISHVMPANSASAANTAFAWFGNLSYAYLGDRKRITLDNSPHYGFNTLTTYFRMVERIGIAIPKSECFSVLKTAAA